MSDYAKGKLFGTFLNKHRLSYFDKLKYTWVITLLPFFTFLYFLFHTLALSIHLTLIIFVYLCAYVFFDMLYSRLKMKQLVRTIPKEVLLYFPNESTLSLLIIYPLLGQPGSLFARHWAFSKEFWHGFRETYWAMRMYYITIICVILPAFIFTLIISGALILNIVGII